MEGVNEVKRHIIECIKNMKRREIRVSLDEKSVELEYKRFERALARRLKMTLKRLCDEVEVSAEWLEPLSLGIDVICKSGGGEIEYYVNTPIMIKIDTDSLSEKDVEIIE